MLCPTSVSGSSVSNDSVSSRGVIVYGMVTGGLPFSATGGGGAVEGGSRSQLRAAIARGMTRRQRAALSCVSTGEIIYLFVVRPWRQLYGF